MANTPAGTLPRTAAGSGPKIYAFSSPKLKITHGFYGVCRQSTMLVVTSLRSFRAKLDEQGTGRFNVQFQVIGCHRPNVKRQIR